MNKKYLDDNHAQNTISQSLKLPLRLVSLVGKPFYFTLIAIIYFVYITGYIFRTVLNNSIKYFSGVFLTIAVGIPKLLKQKVKENILPKSKEKSEVLKKKTKLVFTLFFKSFLNIVIFASALIIKPTRQFLTDIKTQLKTGIKNTDKKIVSFRVGIRKKLNLISNTVRNISYPKHRIFTLRKRLLLKISFLKLFLKKLIRKISTSSVEKKPKTKREWKFSIPNLRITFFFFILFITVSVSGGFIFWRYILKDLPATDQLITRKQAVSTKIYDRNKVLLYTIYKDFNRSPIPLSQIPIQVRLSTLAIEDAEFYNHPGFSLRGIARALYKNFKKGELTGGSTITQQLVKNALLTPEKTMIRKIKEVVLAIKVERAYSKDQILEMYLNEVGYGGTAYGIQEGARLYFGKDVQNLSLGEAAVLAAIPKSPTHYSPFGNNPQNATARQKEVLHLMEVNGYITQDQRIAAEDEDLKFVKNKIDIKAPHFVMFVKDLLEEKYGTEVVVQGGLEVVTTLDYEIQKLAESLVAKEVDKLGKLNVTNGAVVVLNPQTGEILAMVGSHDYFDQKNDGNVNVATALRQPGSSIKIINYAYALSHGYTAASILDDTPVTFQAPNQEPYTPKNYEGGYRGKISLRSAFAESRNIPAVKVLNSYGVKNMIDLGQKMGITTWTNPQNYGLSLTLGGGDVKLLDLSYVYATVANYGKKPDMVPLLKVASHDGKILEEFDCSDDKFQFTEIANATGSAVAINSTNKCDQEQTIPSTVAFIITDILRDNAARSPSFGTNSQLVIPKHPEVAVKTGTSNNLRDNLTIGYSQKYVVAVWVGNNNNSPMSRIASGVTGASTIFNQIMSGLLANEAVTDWITPPGLVQLPICQYTGTLACAGCPLKLEWFLEETKPTYACKTETIEQIVKNNTRPQILDEAWRDDN